MRITIRTRILSIFIAVTLIQAVLMGAFFLRQNHIARNTLVHQQLTTVCENLKNRIDIFLSTTLHDLETASQQVERMAQKQYQRYNLLKTLKNHNSSFSSIVFYDINGIVQSSISNDEQDKLHPIFAEDTALFNIPYYSGNPYVSQISTDTGSPALVFSQPVKFLDNSYIIGVMSAIISFDTFKNIITTTVFPPDIRAQVLNHEGLVLARNPSNEPSPTSYSVNQQWNGNIVFNGIHYISVSSVLDFHGQKFTISARIDANKSWIPNTRTFILLVFLILLLLILSALIGWTTNKKIIEPLQLLANDSATLLQGKDVAISPSTDAEFQDVANAMNSMNMQLQQSNLSLEKEVQRRRSGEKQAILAKIEAEKATQAKSIFLANMSHEIRTPLHGMLGMLEMISKAPLNPEQKQLLSMTTLSGERLHTVVDSILDLSQIESGTFKLHHSPFSLSNLVAEVVDVMQIQTANKDILVINHQLSANIPDDLIGDSGRIRQILINLINNSIKFSEKGKIQLKIDLQSEPSTTKVELLFSVSDHGTGISDEAKQTIFEAFDRGDIAKDKIIEGTGLGLTISSEFVQHMKGKLWLSASDKSGSTFCFTILCDKEIDKKPNIQVKNDQPSLSKTLTGIRVFLAEDEFINQRIISAYLEEHGCKVTVCANGKELIDAMESENADIILMDIRMPVMNGLEATQFIRKKEKDSGDIPIPIVALTAQATTDFEEKCKEAGMNDYLTKPIPFKKLLEIIKKLVHSQKQIKKPTDQNQG